MRNMCDLKLYSETITFREANPKSKGAEYEMHCAVMEMLENVNKSDGNSQVAGNNMLSLKDITWRSS